MFKTLLLKAAGGEEKRELISMEMYLNSVSGSALGYCKENGAPWHSAAEILV